MKTRALFFLAALVLPVPAEDDTTVRGVNPADDLTKFEFLPKFTMLDSGSDTSITTTTFKYDRAIQGIYGVNFELPLGDFFSVAGEPDRDDIAQGQYRLILARTTVSGWWFLADPQLWVDYKKDERVHFTTEFEVGKMLTPNTSIWLRGGGHLAGDWDKDDRTISTGFRYIEF